MPSTRAAGGGSRRPGTAGGGRQAAGKTTAGGMLRVKQVKSEIGHPALHRRTLQALGLRHHQDVIEVKDSPSVRGMLFQVRHLVDVAPTGAK